MLWVCSAEQQPSEGAYSRRDKPLKRVYQLYLLGSPVSGPIADRAGAAQVKRDQ